MMNNTFFAKRSHNHENTKQYYLAFLKMDSLFSSLSAEKKRFVHR